MLEYDQYIANEDVRTILPFNHMLFNDRACNKTSRYLKIAIPLYIFIVISNFVPMSNNSGEIINLFNYLLGMLSEILEPYSETLVVAIVELILVCLINLVVYLTPFILIYKMVRKILYRYSFVYYDSELNAIVYMKLMFMVGKKRKYKTYIIEDHDDVRYKKTKTIIDGKIKVKTSDGKVRTKTKVVIPNCYNGIRDLIDNY